MLSEFELEEGIHIISTPAVFAGGEDLYVQTVGDVNRETLAQGEGAFAFAISMARRPIETILEIGAGSGSCTVGLVSAARNAEVIITDTSKNFLKMIPKKISDVLPKASRCKYATLAGEDMCRLSTDSVDCVVVASSVHHILDWRQFIRECGRVIRKGGVLVIQEPMREGCLLMSTILDAALSSRWVGMDRLGEDDKRRLELVRNFIYMVADSSISKEGGEDKHSFLVDDLFAVGWSSGFEEIRFFRNTHFGTFVTPGAMDRRSHPTSILDYLSHFLRDHHGFTADGLSLLRSELFPAFAWLNSIYMRGDGPALVGVTGFRS